MQRIVIRGDDEGRRNAAEIGCEERGDLRGFTVYPLRQIGVVPFDHLGMRNEVSTGSQFFPRRPRGGSIKIWIEQHLKTQLRPILRSLLSYPCCQETACTITSDREPLRVGTNVGSVNSDPCESGPSIIVSRGIRIFRGKTVRHRNNDALGTICQCPKQAILAFKIPCDKSSPAVINENWRSDWQRIVSYSSPTRLNDRVRKIQTDGDFSARTWYGKIFGS